MAAGSQTARAYEFVSNRCFPYLLACVATAIVIAAGTLFLPKGSELAIFLFDYSNESFFRPVYPFTIQNVMYVMVAMGVADLYVRWRTTKREYTYLRLGLLPEDDTTILQIDQLGPIRRRVAELKADEDAFLPRLIDLSILQLMTSKSLDQTVSVFTSMLELISHRVDLSYQTMRFLVWFIPTTGFIGTVVGISISLEGMKDSKSIAFDKVTAGLAVAFYTTIIALVLSAILVFLQNVIQRREELTLNRAADYCLKNLINRVYANG
jgi:biopolymer transport protein ExbB/TolQ